MGRKKKSNLIRLIIKRKSGTIEYNTTSRFNITKCSEWIIQMNTCIVLLEHAQAVRVKPPSNCFYATIYN